MHKYRLLLKTVISPFTDSGPTLSYLNITFVLAFILNTCSGKTQGRLLTHSSFDNDLQSIYDDTQQNTYILHPDDVCSNCLIETVILELKVAKVSDNLITECK